MGSLVTVENGFVILSEAKDLCNCQRHHKVFGFVDHETP